MISPVERGSFLFWLICVELKLVSICHLQRCFIYLLPSVWEDWAHTIGFILSGELQMLLLILINRTPSSFLNNFVVLWSIKQWQEVVWWARLKVLPYNRWLGDWSLLHFCIGFVLKSQWVRHTINFAVEVNSLLVTFRIRSRSSWIMCWIPGMRLVIISILLKEIHSCECSSLLLLGDGCEDVSLVPRIKVIFLFLLLLILQVVKHLWIGFLLKEFRPVARVLIFFRNLT